MHAAQKLQCGRVTGNKKFTIGGLIGRDNINLDGYKVVQLKSCIQFDGANCGVICLKVLRLCIAYILYQCTYMYVWLHVVYS